MSHAFSLTRLPSAAAACLAAGLATGVAPPAQAQGTGCVTVDVQNVRPHQGQLMLAAYASAETYGRKPMAALSVPAGEATMSVQLCGLSGSEVALTLFQDLNGDGRMARNLLGLPTEPWGASGQPGFAGPSWETAKVGLDGRAIAVRMSL